jgi:lipopolysaccharide/colanic/teichoic acid biosynthesis glycosyltransferase
MKRLFDFVVAGVSLVILLPLLLVVVIAILLQDGWPVFFFQKRVGINGKEFSIIKFRTMSVMKEAGAGRFDVGDYSLITTLGRLLRKSKIDELPQLLNVLLGDMSLVGPRPEISKWVNEFADDWQIIHTVRPGITDPASVIYSNEEVLLAQAADPTEAYRNAILPHKLSLYKKYIKDRSFFGDIAIIVKTVLKIIK